MRIGIDAHMVGARETGNETYCLGLVEGLGELGGEHEFTVYVSDSNVMAWLDTRPGFGRAVLRSTSNAWRLLVGFAASTRADSLDLLHVTYNVPLFAGCPLVVSVHDISYVHFPEFFSARDRCVLSAYVPFSVRQAQRVITLSESAASDIERAYSVPAERIAVIPLAARAPYVPATSPDGDDPTLQRLTIRPGDPFILAVGNLQPRKNLTALVRAFASLPSGYECLRLVIAGKAQWRQSELHALIDDLGLASRVTFTGYVSDQELAALYRGCTALVYPSLYEGFGLPVLEAMACGAPVICSNTSSLPEVAGDAAFLVDPMDVGSLASAISCVVGSHSLQRELRAKGLQRASRFSWRETARRTVQVYEECAIGAEVRPSREAIFDP